MGGASDSATALVLLPLVVQPSVNDMMHKQFLSGLEVLGVVPCRARVAMVSRSAAIVRLKHLSPPVYWSALCTSPTALPTPHHPTPASPCRSPLAPRLRCWRRKLGQQRPLRRRRRRAQDWRQCAGHHGAALAAPHLLPVGLPTGADVPAEAPAQGAAVPGGEAAGGRGGGRAGGGAQEM